MAIFHKILVVYSEKMTKQHISSVEKVGKILNGYDMKVIKSKDLNETHFFGIDLTITVGGDGVFIKTAGFINNDVPILGINSEPEASEGALTSIKDDELDELKRIMAGNYRINKLRRLNVKINGKSIREEAINEAYFGTESQFHVSRYVLEYGFVREEQRSSGVLIVTSSGSGAWFKSAGGIPFGENEKFAFLVREPYTGERIYKPKLLSGEVHYGKRIGIKNKRHDGTIIAIDGNKVYPLKFDDEVEISISDRFLRVLHPTK